MGVGESSVGVLLLSTVLVNNVVLTRFLGLCPFVGATRRMDAALGLGLATGLVLVMATAASHLLYHYLLLPLDAPYLRTIGFIFVIAVAVQATELTLRRASPVLYRVLGIYLPLITTNCAVLGVAILSVESAPDLRGAVLFGLGAALGFALAMVLFAAVRERVDETRVPAALRGAPIALLSAALLALAFMGFAGLDRAS